MPRVLVCTVGGSCQPIVAAIRDYMPDFVYFIASAQSRATVDGEGRPCRQYNGEDLPAIVKQAGLSPEQYAILELTDPDSLSTCYAEMSQALADVATRFPDAEHIVDYTGGTKTMSVSLVLAALDGNWKVSLVKGARTDLVRVADGTEIAGLVNIGEVRARRRLQEVRALFNTYEYRAAENLIRALLQSAPLSVPLQQLLRDWIALCRGFDAWDRFDHARAEELLRPHAKTLGPVWRFLLALQGKGKHSEYEPVFDLLRNAERRAESGRYDDAVARLYRAVEMLAQIRLRREYGQETGDIDVARLPETLRAKYEALRDEDGKVRLALMRAYDLLHDLDDPLGRAFAQQKKEILNALKRRNASILAHGTEPLSERKWRKVREVLQGFIEETCEAMKVHVDAPQFPHLNEQNELDI
ncbi:hypothetical protein ARMA_1273 [Ardenticatena maritima]|uniref:Csm6 6H domain-containing protein n=1 Tax=Ardenticatena maritima TaxID=872965 RepID=A0A0N0RFM9_9CHLR|nr:TIGR02710 family CRISPR-associated CARF protein [Ardenticatena maritima]KPL89409.1 hypothetical protein SE16_02860 [Ardenticatena maritima]GAP62850.1 hypothetical protein ARMA_1273 [Ardenticatena maritima]